MLLSLFPGKIGHSHDVGTVSISDVLVIITMETIHQSFDSKL